MITFKPRNRISFFVGPNGCGKTQELLRMQEAPNGLEKVASISNATFNRFARSTGNRPVLRVSPHAVTKTTGDNLVHFFDAKGRDTFDISALLDEIGFHSEISLTAILSPEWNRDQPIPIKNREEADAVTSVIEKFFLEGVFKTTLTESSDSYQKSLRGRNRAIFKHIKRLKKNGVIKNYELTFIHKMRGTQFFSQLSSGEQTLITTFLFIKSNLKNLRQILIDEPENSLHPQWQRKYLEFLHMAIGYNEVEIVIDTHSPIVVSGAIESYKHDVNVYSIQNNRFNDVCFDEEHNNVEEILLAAFDTITPSNNRLSEIISELTWDVQEKKITKSLAIETLEKLLLKSYSESQKEFILSCKNIINKINVQNEV